MKIGILTHPLHTNYGGLLQAFALQSVLERMGHNVSILHREYPIYRPLPLTAKVLRIIKNFAKGLLGKPQKGRYGVKQLENATGKFKKKYLNITPDFYTSEEIADYTSKERFDAYVVGSDQVWRPKYSACITDFFLGFLKDKEAIRISYAASFGVEDWEYSEEETQQCSDLAKYFKAISVREASGVKLCKEYLGIDAVHVLDPTMLLDAEDYRKVFANEKLPRHYKGLFCYVLDTTGLKQNVIDKISSNTNLYPTIVNTSSNQKYYLTVAQWLKCIAESKVVVTDSFHGTVFCIIFNKPFWVVGNSERGFARFSSLLALFGLENRLIKTLDDVKKDEVIDWDSVNARRLQLKEISFGFINKSLKYD